MKKYINILFKILTRGDNFEEVYLMFTRRAGILNNRNITVLYDYIAEYIATSRDCLKLVHNITLDYSSPTSFKLSEIAGNVEIKQMNNLKSAIYQIANIYDPKVRFSFCNEEWNDGSSYDVKVKIKKVEFE
ncbi:unnamed protein product [Meloidogyne enterolobii]|uniref:Uncharacterized protein n=1 Tax=Meloidogyne enterolobii TaxID=390850 RepID=A0ACB0YQC0_MELEN